MIDVPDVEFDALRPRQRVATLDLCVTRDARTDLEPAALECVVVGHLLREGGARADQAHFADEHVPQLRQLVEARCTEHLADRRCAVRVGPACIRGRAHGAELGDHEWSTVAARPDLSEQNGSSYTDDHGQGHHSQKR